MSQFGQTSKGQTSKFAISASIAQVESLGWLSATAEPIWTLQHSVWSYLEQDSNEALREVGAIAALNQVAGWGSVRDVSTRLSDLALLIRERVYGHIESLESLSESDSPALPGGSDPQPVNESLLERMRGTSSREGTDSYAWYAQMNDDWD